MSDLRIILDGPRDLARHGRRQKRLAAERREPEVDAEVDRLERVKVRMGARWTARHEKRLQNAKDELARLRSLAGL